MKKQTKKTEESVFIIRNISEAGRLMAIFLANGYEVHINDIDNEGHKMFEVRVIDNKQEVDVARRDPYDEIRILRKESNVQETKR